MSVYPYLRIHDCVAPKLMKITNNLINLNSGNSRAGVVNVIQNESWFFEDHGSKEFRFFRIKKNFYLAAIEIDESLVTGIYTPFYWQYDAVFQNFEGYDHSQTGNKVMGRYINWKRDYLANKTSWKQENPTEQGLKEVLIWGHGAIMAHWDGEGWITEEGNPIDQIWGWMEYE